MWIREGDMGACMGEMQGLGIGGGELARSGRMGVRREGGGRGLDEEGGKERERERHVMGGVEGGGREEESERGRGRSWEEK